MNATELLNKLIKRKIPRAAVSVIHEPAGYKIRVVSDHFRGNDLAERRSLVCGALERAPLNLVAKIQSIDCVEG